MNEIRSVTPRPIDLLEVASTLHSAKIDTRFHQAILESMPAEALGVLLYGSVARGDAHQDSDIDMLVLLEAPRPNQSEGLVNITRYGVEQLKTAVGTLYGMHLARDGLILHDAGVMQDIIASFDHVDTELIELRLRRLASLLTLPSSEILDHLVGFTRHARYVLRTSTYLKALKTGDPCFSVPELAEKFRDPDLHHLLSSHPGVQGNPTEDRFKDLYSRIIAQIGPIPATSYLTINDAIVGYGAIWPEVSDAGILILNQASSDPYSDIPRVIL